MNLKPCLIVATVLLVAQPLAADCLVLKNGNRQVFGIIESIDDAAVTMSVFDSNTDKYSEHRFLRDNVATIIPTINQDRLSNLSIDRLSQYRDCAEELSSFHSDPVARRFALRLLMICIRHAGSNEEQIRLQQSAAKNLPALARTEHEKRLFESIAFLYGDDRKMRGEPIDNEARDPKNDEMMLQVVQSIRRERYGNASKILKSELGKKAVDSWSRHCSADLLDRAVLKKATSPDLLAKLLTIELEILHGSESLPNNFHDSQSTFAFTHRQSPTAPRWIPTIEDIADFDLEKTQFENGKWRRPKK